MKSIVSKVASLGLAAFLCAALQGCDGLSTLDSQSGSEVRSLGGEPYPGQEKYADYGVQGFVETAEDPRATFGIDVDAGSYTLGRNSLQSGAWPDPHSVRPEEYINYFDQDYPKPAGETPFSLTVQAAPSPVREGLHVMRVGLQGRTVAREERLPWNMTFLVDVSGSMTERISLVKQSLHLLTDAMEQGDRISIATYAGEVRTVLRPTSIGEMSREDIKKVVSDLITGGGTAMGSGIDTAYALNASAFLEGGVNRVVICSDGDANVGNTTHEAMLEEIGKHVDRGITLSTLGFGRDNYNDHLMEQLADKGNGNYYYIDSESEAALLFGGGLMGLMQVIAQDVKVQVVFDPDAVQRYRLIGYENRAIDDDDFDKDTTDAGELGSGHRVTALFEMELKPQAGGTLASVHLRYQPPGGGAETEIEANLEAQSVAPSFAAASARFRFTTAVAEFAEILRRSPHAGNQGLGPVKSIIESAGPLDAKDSELLSLVEKAGQIDPPPAEEARSAMP